MAEPTGPRCPGCDHAWAFHGATKCVAGVRGRFPSDPIVMCGCELTRPRPDTRSRLPEPSVSESRRVSAELQLMRIQIAALTSRVTELMVALTRALDATNDPELCSGCGHTRVWHRDGYCKHESCECDEGPDW